jgi:hypothetical protein
MKKSLFFLTTLLLLLQITLFSQEDWQWGYQGINNTHCYVEIGCIDKLNNTYSIYPYDSVLYLKDTVFSHDGFFYMWPNYAIVKTDPNGNFINALDFHTSKEGALWNEHRMAVDNDLNLYVMVQFKDSLYINGISFSSKTSSIDLILLKFNSKFELLWSKLIYSDYQDWCHGLALTKSNEIFIYTEHDGSGLVNFLDQDSSFHSLPMMSFMRIDKNGGIIWRKDINSTNPGMFGGESTLGEDGNFYGVGASGDTLFIDGDTVYTPFTGVNQYHIFDIAFRSDGSLRRIAFPNSKIMFTNKLVDTEGNYLFSAIVHDTVIFGSDTLNHSIGNYASLIGKMDSLYNPIWYKKLDFTTNTGYSFSFRIDSKKDTLYFAVNCFDSFEFMDSIYNVGDNESIFYGQFSTDGELIKTNIAYSSSKLVARNIKVDNCYNYYISGYFKGELIIGNDTLVQNTQYPESEDGLVARISDINNLIIDLGSDTTISISETIVLSIPEYFNDILWSTGDTSNSIILSGIELQEGLNKIWVDANQGSCFVTDTILIYVIDDSGISTDQESAVYIYPNPTKNSLSFYTRSRTELRNIRIINQVGQTVYESEKISDKVDVSNLKSGFYIVEFEHQNKLIQRKIVVK